MIIKASCPFAWLPKRPGLDTPASWHLAKSFCHLSSSSEGERRDLSLHNLQMLQYNRHLADVFPKYLELRYIKIISHHIATWWKIFTFFRAFARIEAIPWCCLLLRCRLKWLGLLRPGVSGESWGWLGLTRPSQRFSAGVAGAFKSTLVTD